MKIRRWEIWKSSCINKLLFPAGVTGCNEEKRHCWTQLWSFYQKQDFEQASFPFFQRAKLFAVKYSFASWQDHFPLPWEKAIFRAVYDKAGILEGAFSFQPIRISNFIHSPIKNDEIEQDKIPAILVSGSFCLAFDFFNN